MVSYVFIPLLVFILTKNIQVLMVFITNAIMKHYKMCLCTLCCSVFVVSLIYQITSPSIEPYYQ